MAEEYFLFDFKVTENDFISFSKASVFEKGTKGSPFTRVLGVLEALLGFGVIIWGFLKDPQDVKLMIIGAVLLVISSISLIILPYVYPSMMEKQFKKSYAKTGYEGMNLRAEFTKSGFSEINSKETTTCSWKDVIELLETDEQFFIRIDTARGMLIPKRDIGKDRIKDLRKMFKAAAEAFEFDFHRIKSSDDQ